jgi:hypothetical protein
MATNWNRLDDNALRAHLQEALAERRADSLAEDYSYSGYDLAAIREELRDRQLVRVASRHGAERSTGRPATFRLSY